MHINRNIITAFGPRLVAEPSPPILHSAADRADLARLLDLQADVALREGDFRTADLLSWRAAGLREAAA